MSGRDDSGVAKAAAGPEQLSKVEILLDGLRRLKTHSPVMMLPRLVLSQHLATSLARSRKRLADSHRHLHRLMGEDVDADDEGNITLQGDTTITNHGLTAGGLLKAALAAALVGGGGKLAWDWYHAPSGAPAVTQPAATQPADVGDWKLGVVVERGPFARE